MVDPDDWPTRGGNQGEDRTTPHPATRGQWLVNHLCVSGTLLWDETPIMEGFSGLSKHPDQSKDNSLIPSWKDTNVPFRVHYSIADSAVEKRWAFLDSKYKLCLKEKCLSDWQVASDVAVITELGSSYELHSPQNAVSAPLSSDTSSSTTQDIIPRSFILHNIKHSSNRTTDTGIVIKAPTLLLTYRYGIRRASPTNPLEHKFQPSHSSSIILSSQFFNEQEIESSCYQQFFKGQHNQLQIFLNKLFSRWWVRELNSCPLCSPTSIRNPGQFTVFHLITSFLGWFHN